MRRAASVSDFLADPIGRYFSGRRTAAFAYAPTLFGLVSWGRPDVDDVRELLHACEIGLAPNTPHRFLADMRGLELIEPRTFGLFLEHTTRNADAMKRNIVKQAQIRPEGMVGAIISGFAYVAKLPYPDRVFGDVEGALAWLEVPSVEGVELFAELDRIRSSASEGDELVTRLRRELDLGGALRLRAAARRIGLSTRSLQRALRDAGTTYRVELEAFRVRRAQELLREPDRNLAWIATDLGFSSLQHFATAFRRKVGETPSAWRSRHR